MESAIIFDRTKYKNFDKIYQEVAIQYFESEYFESEYFESDFFNLSKSPFLQGFSSSFKSSYDAPEQHFEKFRDAVLPYIKAAYQGASTISNNTGITFPLVLSMSVAGLTATSSAAIPLAAIMYFARQPLNKLFGKGVSAAVDAVMGPDQNDKKLSPEPDKKLSPENDMGGNLQKYAQALFNNLLKIGKRELNPEQWRNFAATYNKINDQARKIPYGPQTKNLKDMLGQIVNFLKQKKPVTAESFDYELLNPELNFPITNGLSFRNWLKIDESIYMTEEEKQGFFSRMAKGLGSFFGATTGYVAGATKNLFTGLANRVKEIYKYVTNNPKMVVKLAAIVAVSIVTGGVLGKVSHSIQDAISQKVAALVPDVNPQDVQSAVAQVAPVAVAADMAQAKGQAVADLAQAKGQAAVDVAQAKGQAAVDVAQTKAQAAVDAKAQAAVDAKAQAAVDAKAQAAADAKAQAAVDAKAKAAADAKAQAANAATAAKHSLPSIVAIKQAKMEIIEKIQRGEIKDYESLQNAIRETKDKFHDLIKDPFSRGGELSYQTKRLFDSKLDMQITSIAGNGPTGNAAELALKIIKNAGGTPDVDKLSNLSKQISDIAKARSQPLLPD